MHWPRTQANKSALTVLMFLFHLFEFLCLKAETGFLKISQEG